jgi:sodium/proline symporter
MVPGVLLATLAILLVTRLGRAPSPAMEGLFDSVQGELRRNGA